jgi:flagellar biosynthetic protein FliQ
MGDIVFFDTLREGLWAATLISAPILGIALVVGLLIGLVQALTSIQEMTLTFVPKLIAMLGMFWLSMTFMTDTLVDYFRLSIVPLVGAI